MVNGVTVSTTCNSLNCPELALLKIDLSVEEIGIIIIGEGKGEVGIDILATTLLTSRME